MRRGLWLAGLVLALAGARPAGAQSALTFGRVGVPTQYQVVSTNTSALPIGGTTARKPGFTLTGLFRPLGTAIQKPFFGTTNFPTNGQLPDKNYFAPFGMHRAQRISP